MARLPRLAVLLLLGAAAACAVSSAASGPVPAPAVDAPLAKTKGRRVAVVAGGCFWGIEAVYRHVKGATSAVSGYAGGTADTAHYEIVGTGQTGHAESVQVTYDPSQITYGQLLRIFFSVAHDPTTLNRQGPDVGTQYRSAIFYHSDEQRQIARLKQRRNRFAALDQNKHQQADRPHGEQQQDAESRSTREIAE
jgi:peptide-methionine (S)-S-oxide reductase